MGFLFRFWISVILAAARRRLFNLVMSTRAGPFLVAPDEDEQRACFIKADVSGLLVLDAVE